MNCDSILLITMYSWCLKPATNVMSMKPFPTYSDAKKVRISQEKHNWFLCEQPANQCQPICQPGPLNRKPVFLD